MLFRFTIVIKQKKKLGLTIYNVFQDNYGTTCYDWVKNYGY